MTQHNPNITRLQTFAKFLDSQFKLPFGLTIGWDAILGLIPGIGGVLTTWMGLFIVIKSALLGCPPAVLAHMGINLLIDSALEAIPFFGNIADVFWKSNNRNMHILQRYLENPVPAKRAARFMVGLVVVGIVGVSLFLCWAGFKIAQALFMAIF